MLDALLSLVASVGALSVLAGVVSGVIFLVDTALHWASAERSSLEPLGSAGGRSVPHSAANGTANHNIWNGVQSEPRIALQTLDVTLRSSRARSRVGDGEPHHTMGEPDDVHDGVPGVRQLMERLVETLVSGGLDDVVLRPNNPHPQYGRIYKRHQPRLRSALTSLAYSLQMAMAQKPLTESETPGRAHAQLRAIILDLARDVAALDRHPHPLLENGDSKVDTIENDFSSRAYEDILATAIVNKVMERSSNKSNKRNNNNFVSSLEVRVGSVEDSPESCTSSYTESWTSSGHSPQPSLDTQPTDLESDPLSLMIEECIEEVTTITGPSSSGTASSASSLDECSEEEGLVREVPVVRRRRRRRSTQRRGSGPLYSGPPSVLAGLSFLKQRVPFPELGADIVDADWLSGESEVSENELAPPPECRDGSDGGSDGWQDAAEGSRADSRSGSLDSSERPASCLEVVTPLQSWEDNWLFQSRRVRKPAAQYSHHPVPVPMLVPNPSEDFRALIGDVDAEETSDLSECSDDALEEVVLNGLRPEGGRGSGSDQFSEERGHPSLEGLAETCNLELLRRTAPALSTAPAPRGQRTDRSPNADKSASSPTESEKTSTIQSAAKSPAKLANGGPPGRPQSRSPVDLAGRWARDQDAEMTILYDTPTRREAPAKRQPVSKTVTKPDAKPDAMPIAKPAVVDQNTVESKSRTAAEQVKVDKSEEKLEVKPEVNGKTKDHPESEVLSEPEAEEVHLKLNGDAKRPQEPTGASADEEEDGVDLFTPPRPGTIAEREHRKWQEATPLANNPYSPENIQRRLQQRASQPNVILGPTAPLAVLPPDTSLQIALRADPDPKKYGRDFYINSRSGDEPSSGLRRSHSTSVADRRNGHLEMPISPWCSGVRTNGDGGSEDGTQQTPSVKELAKQFIGQPQELMEPQQVHSLTARSMTREFREGLRHLAASSRAASRPAAPLSPLSPPGGPPRPATQPDRPDPEGARQPVDAE